MTVEINDKDVAKEIAEQMLGWFGNKIDKFGADMWYDTAMVTSISETVKEILQRNEQKVIDAAAKEIAKQAQSKLMIAALLQSMKGGD
ncbi:MAG: hypothetical protein NC114_12225 [Ruminococcus flavefaciens]|nr:hypothetical protein [Ruminococcus flavefaciens]